MKNVYFMHIPKTGGRYVEDTLIYSLNIDCKINEINTRESIKTGHLGWGVVNDNTFSFSFIRNPVYRTISHIIFYNPFLINESKQESKNNVLDYLYNINSEFLINYQTKFLCSTDANMYGNFYKNFDYNLDLLDERLGKINHISKTEDISEINLSKLYDRLCGHLGILPNLNNRVFSKQDSEIFFNRSSTLVFESLSISEKSMIESLNHLDMDLWESKI